MKYHKIAKPYFKHIHKISKTYLKHIQNTFKRHINTQHIPTISHFLVVSSTLLYPPCVTHFSLTPLCIPRWGGSASSDDPVVVTPLWLPRCVTPLCQPPLEDGAENNFKLFKHAHHCTSICIKVLFALMFALMFALFFS